MLVSLEYPIYTAESYIGLETALLSTGASGASICVCSDENVAALYLEEVLRNINTLSSKVSYHVQKAGEEHKNLNNIEHIYKHFVKVGLDRHSFVLALGGGVVGDMAGFAAATYMRGVRCCQIPTTLLSQVDSGVGGKTGVDFMGFKNLIGAFYQPAFVYINASTLKTLPDFQFSSGMAEVIKHGLICDKPYLDMIYNDRDKIKSLFPSAIRAVVEGSCRIKSSVVLRDEKESSLRMILNFGHTFGHAIESLSGFAMPHGHAVSVGMCAALRISQSTGAITNDEIAYVENLLSFFSLPTRSAYDPEEVLNQMSRDKKNRNGQINIVALTKLGEAEVRSNVPQQQIFNAIMSVTE
ncbi:MAG: 3-dehydroquinate synthase [Clostridiales bacterium]|jgi:3-dehydroquinate synthase|nr:3-dehydroquinate synthase [Clostridiales bacterium]